MVAVLLFLLIVFLAVVASIIIRNAKEKRRDALEKKHYTFVQEHSVLLRELCKINERYSFHSIPQDYKLRNNYDNANYYETISCKDYLIYQLRFCRREILSHFNLARQNRIKYVAYEEEMKALLPLLHQFDCESQELRQDTLYRLEEEAYRETKYCPVTETYVSVLLVLTKMNGVICASKAEQFSESEINALLPRLIGVGGFYQDRAIWDSICRVERGKVSNQLRFQIYERDGYRCKQCGRTEDEVGGLEIDHIRPISQGGKSELHNLQTLCRDCNKEKGATYRKY